MKIYALTSCNAKPILRVYFLKNIQGVLAKLAISPEWIAQQCSINSGRHLFAKLNELFIFLFNCYNSIDVIACNRRQRALLTRL